jgi:hypothetical protein
LRSLRFYLLCFEDAYSSESFTATNAKKSQRTQRICRRVTLTTHDSRLTIHDSRQQATPNRKSAIREKTNGMNTQRSLYFLLAAFTLAGIIYSCSKGGDDGPADPCAGITVVVAGNSSNPSAAGASDGSIAATASGGSGFTYRLNNGSFQSSGNFTNLAAGTYTVTARNSNGCTGTRQFVLTDPIANCTGVTITVTANSSPATPCATPSTGSITASATGSTGFTFSIDGVNFQGSGNFAGLAPGTYTVTAKDQNGCTGSSNVTVSSAAAGPLFSAVKTLMDNNCVSCHNNSIQNGGMNWAVECNIILNRDRVKARAVDNNPSSMPPTGALSQADKDKITAWINAGGRYTD